ncbi:MAG: hypothetical protein FJW40_00990 [Acidobacteria bacterium]|nr:hypothetical protein [Acidobacteriota bacterium]
MRDLSGHWPGRGREGKFFVGALLVGFGIVLAAMVGSGLIGLRALGQIDRETSSLTAEQLRDTSLIDELAHHQAALGVLLYSLADEHRQAEFLRLTADLREERSRIERIVRDALTARLVIEVRTAWQEVAAASGLVFEEAERLVGARKNNSPELSVRYRSLTAASDRLMEASLAHASRSRGALLVVDDALLSTARNLFLAALGLAAAIAALTVAASMSVFKRLERKARDMERLSLRVLSEQEENARRFSQDLHDEFGQTLNAIESSLTVMHTDQAEDRERLRDAMNLVREAQATARDMAQLLRPRILDDFGLDAGLRELARGFSQRTGITVDYRSQVRERMAPLVETHLFRICQEALTNVSRHSTASKVDVSLTRQERRLELTVADDGGGLAPESGGRQGMGIVGMRERAQVIGGDLTVLSQPGAGVTVLVHVPEQALESQPA